MTLATSRRLRFGAVVVIAVGLLSLAAVAGAEPGFSSVVTVPSPSGATGFVVGTPYAHLSCSTTTSCTAVGPDATQEEPAATVVPVLAEVESAGTWGTPIAIALPVGAAASSTIGADLLGVACPSAGDCEAVGGYPTSTKGAELPMVASSTAGAWSSATTAPVPANAAAAHDQAELDRVQCFSVGGCVAAGHYVGVDGLLHGFTDVETAGTWAAGAELTEPSGATAADRLAVGPISCTDAADCVVLGNLLNGTATTAASYVWTEVAGTWGAPATLGTRAQGFVGEDLACPDPATCLVVGAEVQRSRSRVLPADDILHAGVWSGPRLLAMPRLSPVATEGLLSSVACDTDVVCEATGLWLSALGPSLGLPVIVPGAATWSHGTWSTVNYLRLWHPRRSFSEDEFDAVACPSTTACVGLGFGSTLGGSAGITANDFETLLTPIRPVGLPSPPIRIGATGIRNGLHAFWSPPLDDGGTPVTVYTATVEPSGRTCRATRTTCVVHGLADGHRYHLIVTDRNAFGFSKRALNGALLVAGLPPRPPTHVRVEVTTQHVAVSWHTPASLPGEPVLSYLVSVTGRHHFLRLVRTTTTSCVLGLPPGTYRLTVQAVNASGASAPSAGRPVVVHRA